MYSLVRLIDIWNYEIRTFGGQPEFSDSMYERAEDTFGNADVRSTGKALNNATVDVRTWAVNTDFSMSLDQLTWKIEYSTANVLAAPPDAQHSEEHTAREHGTY